jgi:hypothetical protein
MYLYLFVSDIFIIYPCKWLPKIDTLIGFCGTHDNHSCCKGLEIQVKNDDKGMQSIVDAFQHNVIGHNARVIIVNPLVEGFVHLCLMASCTCNGFNSDFGSS